MSSLASLQRAVTGNYFGRFFTMTLLRQTSIVKSLKEFSIQNEKNTKITPVRYKSSHHIPDDYTSISAINRKRHIDSKILEKVDLSPLDDMYRDSIYTQNIENYLGTVKVPIGIVNVNVNGMHANGSYAVPMATTESAMMASFARGCKLINESGGLNTVVLEKKVQRAPEFVFKSLPDAYKFFQWFNRPELFPKMKEVAESTTNHGKLINIVAKLHGNKVITKWMYESGNACGQNICTFATDAAISHILSEAPIQPEKWYLESGASQDKKTSIGLFNDSRGIYVTGELVCPKEAVEKIIKTTVDDMSEFNKSLMVNQYMQGCTGLTFQAANAISAIFIACGQDVGCVAESHVSVMEMEKTREGDLQLRITVPSLMIGTVGGGTSLPSQQTCLSILQLPTENSRVAFAEIILSVVLGGELSLAAAMTAHHFSAAHHKFARKQAGMSKRD